MIILFALFLFLNFDSNAVQKNNNSEQESEQYENVKIKKFDIALQCWTFRKFSFMETLDKAEELGIKILQAYPGQKLNYDGTGTFNVDMPETDRIKVREKLNKLGITIKLFGVAGFSDEKSARELFQFVKDMGIQILVIEPEYHFFPLVDKLANEFNVNVGIHNHPIPSKYWHPGIVYYHIKDLSPKIGICGDTGHWTRSGVVPTEALKLFEGRIFDIHLKDLNEFGSLEAYDVPFGSGKSNIKNILAELSLQNYNGTLTVEHEKEEDSLDPVKPIKEGLDYINKITYYNGYEEILGQWNGYYHKHGWNHYGPGYFELDEKTGVLTSSGGMGLMWYSAKMYDDFVLDIEYKCHAPNTNSGIFIRVPEVVTNNNYIHESFEIQIGDAEIPTKFSTGAVFDAEPAKMNVSNPTGEWNQYRITFHDDLIKVELNGQLINEWIAEPRGKIKSFSDEGYIGLQNHDSHAKVSFRNIYIKSID
jgi:sugar phosphate isomerase/epimerase